MKRFFGFVLAAAMLLTATGGQALAAQPTDGIATDSPPGGGKGRVVSATGVAQVGGQDVFVEVLVVVPPGADEAAATAAALHEQGARPVNPRDVESAEYTTTGLVWQQFFDGSAENDTVTQCYNPVNETLGGEAVLRRSQVTWTNVGSLFSFSWGGTTDRSPSLVKESPGPQYLDGNNDVAWMRLAGATTLAVTWYTTSGTPEADMAMNTAFSWSNSGADYDMETVFLHENGHVVGLGHSQELSAVMYPYYQGVDHDLSQDDIDGVLFLYSEPSGDADFGITVSPATRSIRAGNTARYTVTVTSVNGYNSPVTISVNGEPAGATVTINPPEVTPTAGGSTSKLSIQTSRTDTVSGSYTLTITARGSDDTTHSAEALLIIK